LKVPFLNLYAQYLEIKDEIHAAFEDILRRTAFISGKYNERFEKEFREAIGAPYCLATNCGTSALHMALWALGLGPDDEVIVPVNTFIATSETVSLTGAKPVFVDHDPETYNIDVTKIEAAITPRTRAIIPVHLYGQPADMDAIGEIARRRNLIVIEDACQAHLARFNGTSVGNFGRVAAFSFFPGKNLGAYGDAGAVVTNDESLYETMRRLRVHGGIERYIHDIEGHCYRMSEFQAAVLCVKLPHLRRWTTRRQQVADMYRRLLGDVEQVVLPSVLEGAEHVYHLFVIRVPADKRDALRSYLSEQGIGTGLHYPIPLHLQKAYARFSHRLGDFPAAEKSCREILSLPMCPMLQDSQVEYVCEKIRSFFAK
jgi:dTDP-4-amino-4,6-dideoxygalactose transaminase